MLRRERGFRWSISWLAAISVTLLAAWLCRPTSAVAQAPAEANAGAPASAAQAEQEAQFKAKILPLLEANCNGCHSSENNSGGMSLDVFQSAAHAKKDRKTWEAVERVLEDGSMPPAKSKKQPTKEERIEAVTFLKSSLLHVSCVGPKDPGSVTMRRLNRSEYNNTIRDLCGVTDFQPANDFPSDDVGYGFDNIGDVLSVQPILIEKYLAAAEKIIDRALKYETIKPSQQTFNMQNLVATPRSAKKRDEKRIVLTTEGSAFIEKFNFPVEADYEFTIKAYGLPAGGAAPKLMLRVDGKEVKTFDVDAPADKPGTYSVKVRATAAEKRVAMVFTNPFEDKKAKTFRTIGIESIKIDGPVGKFEQKLPDSFKMILVAKPTTDGTKDAQDAAKAVLKNFARRAYRRPPTDSEIERLMKLYAVGIGNKEEFIQAIKLPLKAILCSPHFLFRVEPDPKDGLESRPLNEHELATRLSYFLWSSMPDAELSKLADEGRLRKPGVLKTQVQRMLKDWKSQSLTSDFAGQWLMTRSVWNVSPDPVQFPAFDDKMKAAMVRETESFFDHIVKNDAKVTDFLDADYTFVNERLAKHYGIPNVSGEAFQKVKLPDTRRGGVLTHASVLTVTSNPTRTSPVKRGKWVLDNLLASPPPPAPPEVPELEITPLKGTLRQQMEQHRANPSCASCHNKLDPLGFGLENFDAVGMWRTEDKKVKIDASGELPGGVKFDGPAELRKVLMSKSDLFRRCLAEKLTTFALGRGLEYYDKCVLDELVLKLKAGEDRFSVLVLAIVESEPFQKRRAKRSD